MRNGEPIWLSKIHNTIINLERWVNNLKRDKVQYELITEFINEGRLQKESIYIQSKLMTQYDKYKTHDYDKEIKQLEEDLIKWQKKYKDGMIKYKIWLINKDFENDNNK